MPAPKFIEGPNTVQTSLYGYDRSKKVQLNNLRGKPIMVLRSDTVIPKNEEAPPPRSTFAKKWVDRSRHIPTIPLYKSTCRSYSHFHHQYTCPKPSSESAFPFPISPTQIDLPFGHTAHDRKPSCLPTPRGSPNSPRLTPEDEMTVKRLFDKLEIPTTPATSSASSSYVSHKTLLELNSKVSKTSAIDVSVPPVTESSEADSVRIDLSFLVDTPKSLSDSRRSSCSDTSPPDLEEIASSCDEVEKPPGHTCQDEAQCNIFRKGECIDEKKERQNMIQWFNDLVQWRHDIIAKKRFGPPRCPPPPLTVTMIGASRSQRANPFHRVGEVHPFAMEVMDHVRRKMDAKRSYRLVPAGPTFPAPHEFMANAKCLEPHLFVEYCYQLTAAAYVDTGLNYPNRRPPIPPRMEPIPEQACRESICSSASEFSSDGEYSDDSDDTKNERLRQKLERHRKRENRLRKLFRRREVLDEIDEEDDD
ncbi:PEHE domain-containing protein [Caenorhabditis elegans]|uniref:PEHE domain-containing protein n=1 Tax=Caenorhabditis elegans TaxID=6239 RepID=Q95XQ9_CAEEL|nr:PEHE domain-containing protein [Caenorhabditis elegans]CCD69905.1 PEHE domain-containing protein [Caenorhabditis elegans]|eukprot:NP_490961.1 Uncharacterized protein CELE_Y39G10AR.7 [Caenorhabditis elegans]